jgi:polyhydroxyalkanoate synthesis repressor PhaR
MSRLIKRYDNRKLYDTEARAYVSLPELARLVRQGETVQVLDNATGADLTAPTLTQVILDEGKRGQSLLPSDLLHDVLRRGGEVLDARIGQLRQGVDGLVQQSLDRLSRFVQRPGSDELKQLRTQLAQLETLLAQVMEAPTAPETPPRVRTPRKVAKRPPVKTEHR